jgi:hypothetical protein
VAETPTPNVEHGVHLLHLEVGQAKAEIEMRLGLDYEVPGAGLCVGLGLGEEGGF